VRAALVLAVAAVVCVCASGSGSAAAHRDVRVYAGLATWVDLYDPRVLAHPEAAVDAMAARGVRTLFLETSNYQMDEDIERRAHAGRFVEAAHADGMAIVAWYVPSFKDPARDERRSLAAIRFRSAGGERFDSFALDIESSVVKKASLRNTRLLQLSRRIRAAAPAGFPLGAIVPSPRGLQRLSWYWPHFPFAELARTFDVFLPMSYFTYRTHVPAKSAAYTRLNINLLRKATGDPALPVHMIGGLARDASPAQVRQFVRAARFGNALGLSLYDFADTKPNQWRELRAAAGR
jgi:hypothetical protein